VVASERSQLIADRINRAQARLLRRGVRAGARVGFKAQRSAMRAFGDYSESPASAFRNELLNVAPILADAMLAAHLSGMAFMLVDFGSVQLSDKPADRIRKLRKRVLAHERKTAAVVRKLERLAKLKEARQAREAALARITSPTPTRSSGTVFGKTTEALKRKLAAEEWEIQRTAQVYREEAVRVFDRTSMLASANITETMIEIQTAGMHVAEAKAALGVAFTKTGLTPRNAYALENLFRTQIQLAYSAGRWAVNQDPAVDELVWGYEYVTARDSRVRPKHQAMDGTKLAKDDPFWRTSWPPNGYSCRCQAIEIFVDDPVELRTPTPPPATFKTIQGAKRVQIGTGKNAIFMQEGGKPVTVTPGPDPGFAYNAGVVLAA